MADSDTKVVISGSVRRGAAIVEDVPIGLTQKGADLVGKGRVKVTGKTVLVNVTVFGIPDTAFQVATTIEGLGTATRKARLVADVALRGWEIEKGDFEEADDD
jgi:hypothetical protein